jgi:hypothetical protein
MAAYVGEPERRIRHLIRSYNLPTFKRGQRLYSRRSWLDTYFGGDDPSVTRVNSAPARR